MKAKTSNYGLVLGIFVLFFTGTLAHADGPIIRSGETVGVEANQVLEGDFYGMGQTITLSGQADHDVYVLGGAITTNAPVLQDLTAVGGVVQVHGAVQDDVRVIGGEVVLAEPVTGDVVVLGGTVHILSTASVGGDVIFLGGEVRIDGPVTGTVYGAGDTVRIDAAIGGDVHVQVGQTLLLGNNADIKGNILYTSPAELTRAQSAVVSGTISREALFTKDETQTYRPLVLNLLVLIFSGLTVFFILRSRTEGLVRSLMNGYGKFGLIGFGMFLALPIVAGILMASIVGLVVGIALLLGYFLLVLVSLMTLPVFCGALLQRVTRLGETLTIFTIVLGVFVMIGLGFVPIIGGFALFVAFLMIMGAICNELYRFFKSV